jgi:hypothetical protein
MISQLGSSMKDLFGDFSNAYLLAAGILVVATIMMALVKSLYDNLSDNIVILRPL